MSGRLLLRLLILLLCVPLLLPLASCQTPTQQADQYAQQAQQLFDGGSVLPARIAIRNAIALRDNNASYFLLLAAIEMRSGNAQQAFDAAKRALDLDGGNTTALTLVANLGLQVGQIDDASQAADQLLSVDPGSLVALQVKGLVALYRNKAEEAEGYASKLLAISPSDEAGVIVHARVLAKERKFEEALAAIDQAMAEGRVTTALLITKINLYRVLGRPQDMAAAFDELDQRAKQQPPSLRLDRINLLYKLGRKDEARQITAQLLASGAAGVDDLDVLERIWWEFDPVPFTRKTITAAKDWPDPVELLSIGRYLLWQGQPQLADDLYFAVRRGMQPVGLSIHQRAMAGLGETDKARIGAKAILQRDPGDADALLLNGQFDAQAGNMGAAIEQVQKALDGDSGDAELYVALAQLQIKAGTNWRAAQIYEDGLKQLPQNFLLIERYTQFLHESGNKDRAVSATRAFARALPSSALAWTIMARQCAWAADTACAAEAEAGRQAAATRYQVDNPPGTPPDRGLLGKF